MPSIYDTEKEICLKNRKIVNFLCGKMGYTKKVKTPTLLGWSALETLLKGLVETMEIEAINSREVIEEDGMFKQALATFKNALVFFGPIKRAHVKCLKMDKLNQDTHELICRACTLRHGINFEDENCQTPEQKPDNSQS